MNIKLTKLTIDVSWSQFRIAYYLLNSKILLIQKFIAHMFIPIFTDEIRGLS